MANSNLKLHGRNGAIYIGGAKGAGGIKVASKTDWTLQRNRDYIDATVFGDSNKTYLAGLPNVQGTYTGFLDTSGDLLLNAATSDAQSMYLYADDGLRNGVEVTPTPITPVLVAHGPAFIDASVNTAVADGIKTSGDFRASGPWTIDLGS